MKKLLVLLLAAGALASCTQPNQEAETTNETTTSETNEGTVGAGTATTTDDSITIETATAMDTTATGNKAPHGAASDTEGSTQAH